MKLRYFIRVPEYPVIVDFDGIIIAGVSESDLIKELGTPNPDSIRLNQMATEVGNNHRELKQATTIFYLNMKKICTAEQQAKLHGIFQSMLNKENQINLPRPGNQGGRWRNQ